uniref:Uncharacterized protein n=1 Tax=uncultured prokaryote TaxID=198431 RepID=A0A0H5PWT8_9ZZZZ|nr:hypothetical protein [uncultured prokaryote]
MLYIATQPTAGIILLAAYLAPRVENHCRIPITLYYHSSGDILQVHEFFTYVNSRGPTKMGLAL